MVDMCGLHLGYMQNLTVTLQEDKEAFDHLNALDKKTCGMFSIS